MNAITNGSYRTITAFYRDRADADRAVSALMASGLSQDNVRLVPGKESGAGAASTEQDHRGFWNALSDFFFPDDDRNVYAEGLRRGGYLVTVNGINESQHEAVLDILDDEGTIDIDEWSDSWRAEGWSPVNPGFESNSSATPTSMATTTDRSAATGADRSTARATESMMSASSTSSSLVDTADDVIPVVEEQLRVGKRDVDNGRVRVRSYVVETPVSESVSLRDQNVSVERRTVDRPITDADAAFRDRTIEAEEHREEAVIAKEARVKEELVVKRSETERTERIDDSIRHTEVEIEDDRAANARGTGTLGTTPRH